MVPLFVKTNPLSAAGVAAVAIENTEGGKWIKDNYKFSHCIPEELQSQIDHKHLDSFNSFNNWVLKKWCRFPMFVGEKKILFLLS